MTNDPPPPTRPPRDGSDGPTREDLQALAAGELDAATARALGTRIEADEDLAARFAEARAIEEALRAQPPLPLPSGFARRVLARLPARGRTLSWPALARLAAGVVLALGVWIATVGATPTLAHAEPPPVVCNALEPAIDLLSSPTFDIESLTIPDEATDDTPALLVLALAGALLLALGLVAARRTSYRIAPRSPSHDEPEVTP